MTCDHCGEPRRKVYMHLGWNHPSEPSRVRKISLCRWCYSDFIALWNQYIIATADSLEDLDLEVLKRML